MKALLKYYTFIILGLAISNVKGDTTFGSMQINISKTPKFGLSETDKKSFEDASRGLDEVRKQIEEASEWLQRATLHPTREGNDKLVHNFEQKMKELTEKALKNQNILCDLISKHYITKVKDLQASIKSTEKKYGKVSPTNREANFFIANDAILILNAE